MTTRNRGRKRVFHFPMMKALHMRSVLKKPSKMIKKRKHSLSTGDDAQHGSFVLNYTGQMDWGEVAAYIDWYAFIVEGHYTIEVTALADKIIVGFKQLIDTDKYALAFQEELGKMGVSCKADGPYPKQLPKHALPHSTKQAGIFAM